MLSSPLGTGSTFWEGFGTGSTFLGGFSTGSTFLGGFSTGSTFWEGFSVQICDGTQWTAQASVTGNSDLYRWIPFPQPVRPAGSVLSSPAPRLRTATSPASPS